VASAAGPAAPCYWLNHSRLRYRRCLHAGAADAASAAVVHNTMPPGERAANDDADRLTGAAYRGCTCVVRHKCVGLLLLLVLLLWGLQQPACAATEFAAKNPSPQKWALSLRQLHLERYLGDPSKEEEESLGCDHNSRRCPATLLVSCPGG
jgi:hypothetical protein